MILELKIGLACGEITCVTSGKNVEICFQCLYLITLEVWKCGNVEICLHCLNLSNNSGSVEMWKSGNMSSLSSSSNYGTSELASTRLSEKKRGKNKLLRSTCGKCNFSKNSNVSVKSKLQHAPPAPGQPPGI